MVYGSWQQARVRDRRLYAGSMRDDSAAKAAYVAIERTSSLFFISFLSAARSNLLVLRSSTSTIGPKAISLFLGLSPGTLYLRLFTICPCYVHSYIVDLKSHD